MGIMNLSWDPGLLGGSSLKYLDPNQYIVGMFQSKTRLQNTPESFLVLQTADK